MVLSRVQDLTDRVLDRSVVGGYSKLGYAVRRRFWPADPPEGALAGRAVLVTGAGAGLGRATAAGLARLGATVHLLVRRTEKGERARDAIAEEVPGADVRVEICDVSDLSAVRAFAADFGSRVPRLHALVHNAGVLPPERTESVDGHELTLATHVLGPCLMTRLLEDQLAADGDARVVFVSSGGMYTQPLRIDDPEYVQGEYNGSKAYARTKRMQVVLAELLAARVPAGVRVHSMHPGWASTPGITESLPRFSAVLSRALRSAEEGADTVVWLCAADEPGRTSGLFWHDRRTRPTAYLPGRKADDAERARLWTFVSEAIGQVDGTRSGDGTES